MVAANFLASSLGGGRILKSGPLSSNRDFDSCILPAGRFVAVSSLLGGGDCIFRPYVAAEVFSLTNGIAVD